MRIKILSVFTLFSDILFFAVICLEKDLASPLSGYMQTSVTEASSADAAMAVEVAEAPSPPPAEATAPEGGADVNGGGEIIIGMDATTTSSGEGDKINGGGNRWPRPETLALLKIRSDMDAVFRDSSLKGPLWEEVSRKLGELGYTRSAKKCKEKFENVYKYHKRTKDSRSAKAEGKTKTYRFFDQLQALESRFTLSHSHSHSQTQSQSHPPNPPYPQPSHLTSNTLTSLPFPARPGDHSSTTISYITTTTTPTATTTVPSANPSVPTVNFFATATITSTSSSTASDEDLEERYRKKRKWKDYFRRLTRQVLARQEEMQKRFLDAIDKRECERVAQLETWRMQEMARINREHEILVQERSTAAAKDAALIAFLQKLSGGTPQPQPPPPPPLPLVSQLQPQQQQQSQQPQLVVMPNNNNGNYEKFEIQKINYNNNSSNVVCGGGGGDTSSRWPKAEVHALIRLRTSLDAKYQDNGPKAPLWEEISSGMQRLGYTRSAKRCKEKWENINKYFKKIKESNKHRRDDSKTCPYFNELDALYKEKSKTQNNNPFGSFDHNVEPLMVQPEQQWRPPTQEVSENASQYQECEEEEDDDNDGGGGEVEDRGSVDLEDEEEGGGGGDYEINKATNKLSPVDTVE